MTHRNRVTDSRGSFDRRLLVAFDQYAVEHTHHLAAVLRVDRATAVARVSRGIQLQGLGCRTHGLEHIRRDDPGRQLRLGERQSSGRAGILSKADELLLTARSEADRSGKPAPREIENTIRASIYNAVPMEAVESLTDFMKEFARTRG